MVGRRVRGAVAAVVSGLLVAGCGGGGSYVGPSSSPAEAPSESAPAEPRTPDQSRDEAALRYVALGDSFTAAPLVPAIDGASGPCVRSTGNYPALVAEALRESGRSVEVVDRSCVEARTDDLFAPQQLRGGRVAPQARTLDRRTDLVTVGIGGNDVLGTIAAACPGLRTGEVAGCVGPVGVAPEVLAGVTDDLTRALRRIARRAPDAEVLLVGYPRTAPDDGTCPDRLPIGANDVAGVRRTAEQLDEALRQAARRTGTDFVDAYAASAGHDICAPQPWVNGATTVPGEALALHPFARGQEGVARAVLAQVDAAS